MQPCAVRTAADIYQRHGAQCMCGVGLVEDHKELGLFQASERPYLSKYGLIGPGPGAARARQAIYQRPVFLVQCHGNQGAGGKDPQRVRH